MDQGRQMTINLLSYMKLPSYNRAWICRHTVFQRHGSTQYNAKQYSEQYSKHCSEIANHAPRCPSANDEYNPESDPQLQLQPSDRTSLTRIIFGGATITKERDDRTGIATTCTANYLTGNAGTKHCETHSERKPSNGEMSTQRSDGKYISRCFKKPHGYVTFPNEIPTQSRLYRFRLDNPEIHSCYSNSTSESILTKVYDTQRNLNRLVVGRVTTYKRGMAVQQLNQPLLQAITVPEILGGSTSSALTGSELQVEICQES